MTRTRLLLVQAAVALAGVGVWQAVTVLPILGPPRQMQFFFSTPTAIAQRVAEEFSTTDIWRHIAITLEETLLSFGFGAVFGVIVGFLFARVGTLAVVFQPFIKAANALPRVVLAPIFMLWFGLGIWSKVALGFSLVFFIVFFNVYQGVREVPPVVLANARMLGMNGRALVRHVYWPAALTWVFSSLHTSIGFAVVGAVVGEYLGSAVGLGYLIHEAESTFDVTGVYAGMVILTAFVLVIDGVVSLIEGRLLSWKPQPT